MRSMARLVQIGIPYDAAVAEFVKRIGSTDHPLNFIKSYVTGMAPGDRTVTITFIMDNELANYGKSQAEATHEPPLFETLADKKAVELGLKKEGE